MEVKIEVFIIFDKEDRDLLRELKQHLASLDKEGLISVWDEDVMAGGTFMKDEIMRHLKSASLVLLLLSARFMASYKVYELGKQALALHRPPHGYVVPVLLGPVDWEHSDFGQLMPLPTNGQPISSWENRDAAYVEVAKGIRTIIEAYKPTRPPEMELFPLLPVTITTPDGSKYMADVPTDMLVDQLLREFLRQWSSPMIGAGVSMHFSLCTQDALSLDRSSTLEESRLVADAPLMLISERLAPDAPVSLTVEDSKGEHHTTTVLLNTIVGRLAEAFLRTQSGTGQIIVEWLLPATKTKRLKLEETLYNQGVCDNALLRIYRVMAIVEE